MTSKDITIKVENISKRYRIGLKENMNENFGGAIFDFIKSPLNNYRKYRSLYKFDDSRTNASLDEDSSPSDVIWALRDVSFQVKEGEVLGIIGKNGAGKSTLLKVLAKITDPTSGRAEIRGKVSSLLEVGTGFHPELTGRENIYLNSTILGMTKKEVDRKFDAIVKFSGVERFIDTPVKRYSSGMTVRLAFSVAAHLEPDILIIDEVLAVGDAEFQKKCLNKMQDIGQQGRTVLFVSHNMPAVSALCPTSILLENGSIKDLGQTNQVIKRYISESQELSNKSIADRTDRQGNGAVKIVNFWLESLDGRPVTDIPCNEKGVFKLAYQAEESYRSLRFLISIYDDYEQRLLRFDSAIDPINLDHWPLTGTISCSLLTPISLCPNEYTVNVAVIANEVMADYLQYAMHFEVIKADFFGTGRLHRDWPMFLIPHKWHHE